MPDPYTAFQTAAAAVELAQVVTKLVSKFIELKRSADGRSIQHNDLRQTTNTMRQYCQSIDEKAERAVSLRSPFPGGEDLQILTRRCSGVVDKLETTVEKVYSRRGHGIYKSMHTAVKIVLAENKIDELLKNLEMCRNELSLGLIMRIREDMTYEFERLRISNKASQNEMSATIERNNFDLKTQIESLHHIICMHTSLPEHLPQDECALEQVSSNSDAVKKIIDQIESILSKMTFISDEAIRKRIYNDLWFSHINQRYSSIHSAHFQTVDWVYEDQPRSTIEWPSFGNWLSSKSDCRLYCIFGKPGSGKSTLTRHLCEDTKTVQYLKLWAGHSNCIVANHFFWNGGGELQNSEQGLLRTWLFQLLTGLPEHTNAFFPKRYQHLRLGLQSDYDWSDEELRDALFSFIAHHQEHCKILFIVDGLDEQVASEEQRQSTCNLLKTLAGNFSVKVCATSRPWNIYSEVFRGVPSLRLEDLNKADIEKYVEEKFAATAHHRKMLPADRIAYQGLRGLIVSKAQGVFLWVRLVTESILRGACNGDSITDLFERLQEIPADLKEYLCKIIDDIPIFYRNDASRILLSTPMLERVMDFYFIRPSSISQMFSPRRRTYTSEEIAILQEAEIDHLQACCCGLMELLGEEHHPSYEFDRSEPARTDNGRPDNCSLKHFEKRVLLRCVVPLHRTVLDLLRSDKVQQQLIGWYQGSFDLRMLRLYSYLAEMISCDLSQPWFSFDLYKARWNWSVKTLYDLCRKTQCSIEATVEEFSLLYRKQIEFSCSGPKLESCGVIDCDSFAGWRKRDAQEEMNFVAYTIKDGAHPDVLRKMHRLEAVHLQQERTRPYLDYAARPRERESPLAETVEFLLELGADPNEALGQSTVWTYFLEGLPQWPDNIDCAAIEAKRLKIMRRYFEATKSFIIHGAAKVSPLRAKSSSLSNAGTMKKVCNVDPRSAITRAFSGEQQAELLTLLAKHAHSKFGPRTKHQSRALSKIPLQHASNYVDDLSEYKIVDIQKGKITIRCFSATGLRTWWPVNAEVDEACTCKENCKIPGRRDVGCHFPSVETRS